jgi:hypothetical protein
VASCTQCRPKLARKVLRGSVGRRIGWRTRPPLPLSRLQCSEGVFTSGSLPVVEGLPVLIV